MMEVIKKLKERAASLKKYISTLYYASQAQLIPRKTKILILFTIGYAMSPIDLIPDFIPILGYLDDLIILPALISLAIKNIPENIMIESEKKAAEEPLSLRKNWVFGVLFISVWVLIIFKIVSSITGKN